MASLRKSPYLPLYVDAFIGDEKLNECSAAACGVYVRILCLMHKSEEYGRIRLVGRDRTRGDIADFADKLSLHMPYRRSLIRGALAELIDAGVLYIERRALCQKRMIRAASVSEKRSACGRLGMASRYAKRGQETDSAEQSGTLFDEPASPASRAASPAPKKPLKVKYAEDVRMLEKEYNRLVADYGEELTLKFVDKLNNYKLANHKRYADDYRAILSWVVGQVLRDENKEGNHGLYENDIAGAGAAHKAVTRDYDEAM